MEIEDIENYVFSLNDELLIETEDIESQKQEEELQKKMEEIQKKLEEIYKNREKKQISKLKKQKEKDKNDHLNYTGDIMSDRGGDSYNIDKKRKEYYAHSIPNCEMDLKKSAFLEPTEENFQLQRR